MNDATYDLNLLQESKNKWDQSPAVRFFYGLVYKEMMQQAVPGKTLDLGSGIGTFKEYFPDIITSDIEKTPFVDRAVSCYEIEKSDILWDNLLAVDVLHHLRFPIKFFESAAKSLNTGGRIILTEPAATIFGNIFYKVCHHEPIESRKITSPFSFDPNGPNEEFANMGMGMGLFKINIESVKTIISKFGLTLHTILYRDVLAYPLTGGFSKPQLVPLSLIKIIFQLETKLPQIILRTIGLRMLIVLEKK